MKPRLLVVEDEAHIRELLRLYLDREGYEVEEAGDGEHGLELATSQPFDLVVLDIMLPRLDGWEVCRRLRQRSSVPIIMLTAKGEEIDRVLGLELGADDYVSKPFSPRELLARVRAVLRRARPAADTPAARNELAWDDVRIDHDARELVVRGEVMACPAKEFDLLWLLASHPGRVFTREQLLQQVWEYDFMGDTRTVDVHVRRLREKIEPEPDRPRYIRTVWGSGYKFVRDGGG